MLQQVAQGGVGESLVGDAQNPVGHCSGQPAVVTLLGWVDWTRSAPEVPSNLRQSVKASLVFFFLTYTLAAVAEYLGNNYKCCCWAFVLQMLLLCNHGNFNCMGKASKC